MRTRLRPLLAVVLGVLLLTACQVDATVTVRMRENGSGAVVVRVELDRRAVETAEVAGGTLEDRVRLDDLVAAGWRVMPWKRTPAGGASIQVRKPFSDPADVAAIVEEIDGDHGPLGAFRASRATSTFSTEWTVDGSVDLRTIDTGVAADPELVANLTAERVDIAAVEQALAGPLVAGLRVHAVAELPDGRREVTATPGHRAVLRVSTDDVATGRIGLLAGGIALGALALVLLVVGEVRTRSRRRSTS